MLLGTWVEESNHALVSVLGVDGRLHEYKVTLARNPNGPAPATIENGATRDDEWATPCATVATAPWPLYRADSVFANLTHILPGIQASSFAVRRDALGHSSDGDVRAGLAEYTFGWKPSGETGDTWIQRAADFDAATGHLVAMQATSTEMDQLGMLPVTWTRAPLLGVD